MTPETLGFLNSEQVATLLNCSPRTVEDNARDGTFPATKFGDSWIFVPELIYDAVKTISITEAAERRAAKTKSATLTIVPNASKTKRKSLPGLGHLSDEAVREILAA